RVFQTQKGVEIAAAVVDLVGLACRHPDGDELVAAAGTAGIERIGRGQLVVPGQYAFRPSGRRWRCVALGVDDLDHVPFHPVGVPLLVRRITGYEHAHGGDVLVPAHEAGRIAEVGAVIGAGQTLVHTFVLLPGADAHA